jgi:PAS domain S-box-containing protein
MFEDSRGRVWMAGGQTPAVFEDGTFREFGKAEGITTGGVYYFAEESGGELWLANAGGVFRHREGRFVEVLDQGRPIRETACLKSDADGTVWIGSQRGVLLRWRSGRLGKVDATSGLPSSALLGLIDDDHGHTWMATNRGVVRARLNDLHAVADGRQAQLAFQVFDVSDGLPSIECADGRQPVCARDGRGRLWFATRKGAAVVDPAAFRVNTLPPPARVEELVYVGPSAAGGGRAAQGEIVRRSAPFAAGLSLPAGSRQLEFRYTGLSFTAPEKVRFQTKVEGRDTAWQDVGAQRVAFYHAPGPGNYVFRVRAANNDGTWGEPAEGLAFVVEPFYWQTLWFRVAAAALLVGGGAGTAWAVARSRHRRSRGQLQRSQRQSAALVKLSLSPSVTSGDVSRAMRDITGTAAEVLGVNRVSVWLLNDAGDELVCAATSGDDGSPHDAEPVLRAADCPAYFEALRSGRVIDAADALRDSRTSDVAHFRLATRGVSSELDAAVRVSGRLAGAIRHEHVGPRRAWRDDEKAFAAAAADQVAQALLNAEREQTLLRLRESEQRMSLAAEAAHLGMWVWQVASNRIWMTDRCRALFGLPQGVDVTSAAFLDCIHPEDREATEHAIRKALARHVGSETFDAEYRVLLPDGEVRWVFSRGRVEFDMCGAANSTGASAGIQGASADITRRKQAEAEAARQRNELAHLSRVTMLGELSGSLAHELNQPLTAILSNAQSAQRFLAGPEPDLNEIREILRDIVQEDKRAGEVIRRLRLLLKKGEVQQEPLDLNEVAIDVLRLMKSDLVNGGVEVSTTLGDGLPPVNGDRVQLQQVLINLVVNASDAMAAGKSGVRRLSVSTRLAEDARVRVSVSDEGVGIHANPVESVFEPFFTTKPGGMGLGLAVCRTIVRAHGGTLWAENNSDRGATFHMALPTNGKGTNGNGDTTDRDVADGGRSNAYI